MWRQELAASGASPGTIKLRTSYLDRWMRVCRHPEVATRQALVAWLDHPSWAPETRRSARSALVSYYTYLYDEGLLPANADGSRAANPAARLPKVHVPIGVPRPAPDDVIRRAIGRATARVRLMLMLAAIGGMRRAEIAGVHTDDLIGRDLTVHGKGGKVRVITLPETLAAVIRARPPGWLFPAPSGHPLTAGHVGVLMTRVLEGFTPHQLRHAAASYLNEIGLSMFDIRDFLGHASVATTQRYVAVRNSRTAAATEQAAARFVA